MELGYSTSLLQEGKPSKILFYLLSLWENIEAEIIFRHSNSTLLIRRQLQLWISEQTLATGEISQRFMALFPSSTGPC